MFILNVIYIYDKYFSSWEYHKKYYKIWDFGSLLSINQEINKYNYKEYAYIIMIQATCDFFYKYK